MEDREGIGFIVIADLDLDDEASPYHRGDARDELERDLVRQHAQTGPWDVLVVLSADARAADATLAALAHLLPADEHARLRVVNAGSTSATVVSNAGQSAAFVTLDFRSPTVPAQQLTELAAPWRTAPARLLISEFPRPHAHGIEPGTFQLHLTRGALADTTAAAAYEMPLRRLSSFPHRHSPGADGYLTGRIREFDIEARPRRVIHDNSVFRFGDDDEFRLDRHGAIIYALGRAPTAPAPVKAAKVVPQRIAPAPGLPAMLRCLARWEIPGATLSEPVWALDGRSLRVIRHQAPASRPWQVDVASGRWAQVATHDPVQPAVRVAIADRSVRLERDGASTVLLDNVDASSACWLEVREHAVVAASNELVIMTREGDLVRTVAAHDDPCVAVTASHDDQLVATASAVGEIKIWRTQDWAELMCWGWDGGTALRDCIAFSPAGFAFAVCQSRTVDLYEIDQSVLAQAVPVPAASVAAKVVLVGPGRVGKTCLAERLVRDTYSDQPATHGMRFWSVPLAPQGDLEREVVLWDLGGQSEYRLLHQIFLPSTELALLLVEPGTESYDEVRRWSDRLDNVVKCTKILVGTKVDSDDAPVDHPALQRLAEEIGAAEIVLTSALTSRGRDTLLAAIERRIAWPELTQVIRGRAGEWLHDHLSALRRAGVVIAKPGDLEPSLPEDIDRGDLNTAIRQLARRGTIANTRTATGEQVLVLRIEEIERYAGSLIVAAQQRPGGVPALDAGALHTARMRLPRIADDERLERGDERVVLECVVEMLVQQGLVLMHHGQLVFPSLFETGGDEVHQPEAQVHFEFGGAVDNAYASLVTDLALSNAYGTPRMTRHAARFSRAGFGTCGIRRVDAAAGRRGGLEVFFEAGTSTVTEDAFVLFVAEHLRRSGIKVLHDHRVACVACGIAFAAAIIDARIAAGKADVGCPSCDARTRIVLRPDQVRRHDTGVRERVAEQQAVAREGRERAAASGVQHIEIGGREATPHWVLVLSDLHIAAETEVDTMRQTLMEDLRSADAPRPESLAALVVCGDITNRATPAEFERAHAFIGALIEDLPGVTAGNTVVVPGNHDVDWMHPGVYKHHVGARPPGATDAEFIERGGIKLLRDDAAYRESFSNFSTGLYETLYQHAYPQDPAHQVDVFDVPQAGISFVTFNSAWNTAQHSPHSAKILDAAVGNALQQLAQVPADRLKVAVWHHPITGNEKIRDDAFVERLRAAGVRLCLHGHVHESRADLLGYLHPRRMNVVGTGSFGAPAHERVESTPRLYHLLELADDRTSLRVHTRQLARSGGAWEPFYEWPDPADGSKRLPHFDIALLS
ncbi:MAG: metallophosphoesterase [Myxococcota bacterium]